MQVKDISDAASQIKSILKLICNHYVIAPGLERHVGVGPSPEIQRALNEYLGNQNTSATIYTMPPDADIENAETRRGWAELDVLVDIDLWTDGVQSDLTAIFRIKVNQNKKCSVVSLYDVSVL